MAQTRLRSRGARATILSEEALLTLLNSRAAVESTIDRLIGILDALDVADADLEDDDPGESNGDAEPSLGAPENIDQQLWCQGGDLFSVDLEDVNEDGGGEYDEPYDPYRHARKLAGGCPLTGEAGL